MDRLYDHKAGNDLGWKTEPSIRKILDKIAGTNIAIDWIWG